MVVAAEAGEVAAVGRALRKQSGEQEAVRSQVTQTCKVMFEDVCRETPSFMSRCCMALGLSARSDRVDLLLSFA